MKSRSLDFYRLLHEIEYEIGSECYNGNIQNFGPGYILRGIKHALEKLETRFGIDFEELLRREKSSDIE